MILLGGKRMLKRIFGWFTGNKEEVPAISSDNIPEHIAIIMDGNGRWAKRHGLPRAAGHHAGMKNVKKVVMAADELGVKVLTLYAFSTENWKRPKEEVDYLMKLPQEFFVKEMDELVAKNVRISMMGYKENMPAHALQPIEEAIEKTRNNTGLILNFALNYGSRKEMLQGCKAMLNDIHGGQLEAAEISESVFERYLLSSALPDPDLLIRTSGEYRISNFMLWQLAYTELWFTEIYWPDFKQQHLYAAIEEYQKRIRRYGGL
jgi:undecaprenyl diphosphate synthase